MYGAGITITSLQYDIFSYSSAAFLNPPSLNPDCTNFKYKFNDDSYPDQDEKYIYTLYCPIDDSFNTQSTDADIYVSDIQFPGLFVENYPLRPVFSYGASASSG